MFSCAEGIIKPIVYVGIVRDRKLLIVDYDRPPNPLKTGWWIPAPGLDFGDDPKEKAVQVAKELAVAIDSLQLFDVESFVMPGGWHLIYHYVILTKSNPTSAENINAIKWVDAGELGQINLAHGKWEVDVGIKYLTYDAKNN